MTKKTTPSINAEIQPSNFKFWVNVVVAAVLISVAAGYQINNLIGKFGSSTNQDSIILYRLNSIDKELHEIKHEKIRKLEQENKALTKQINKLSNELNILNFKLSQPNKKAGN